MAWRPIETAPKDGRWLLLEGEFSGGDTSSVRVGRWNPDEARIGNQSITYEWQVVDSRATYDEIIPLRDVFNWYAAGRVLHWMPLPEPPESK